MKHSLKVTAILLGLFLLSQFVGLGVIYNYIDPIATSETGETTFKDLPIGERPDVSQDHSYIYVIIAIVLGTILLLLIMKHNLSWLWRAWFFIAISIALSVAFFALISSRLVFILAVGLALWRILRPNFYIHTITEVFVYPGLAAIFVPLFNIFSVILLLILISLYDAYAVWKSKHMITLAKSQTKAKVFAGLLVPYSLKRTKVKKVAKSGVSRKVPVKIRMAMLGGGDIGFSLIFAGVVLKEIGLWQSLLIPLFSVLGLAVIMWKGDKKKFYPAMPFITAGCFLGLLVVWLIGMI